MTWWSLIPLGCELTCFGEVAYAHLQPGILARLELVLRQDGTANEATAVHVRVLSMQAGQLDEHSFAFSRYLTPHAGLIPRPYQRSKHAPEWWPRAPEDMSPLTNAIRAYLGIWR